MESDLDNPAAPMKQVFVILDVDGVLNQLVTPQGEGPGWHWVERRSGKGYWIHVDREIIKALDEQLLRPGVSLGWLTTWDIDVDRLIAGPFEGRLSGGHVIAARPDDIFVPIDWKLRALLIHLDELGNPPYAWADDDAVNEALLFRPSFADGTGRGGGERLLLPTDKEVGLTLDDVDQLREFIDRFAPGE